HLSTNWQECVMNWRLFAASCIVLLFFATLIEASDRVRLSSGQTVIGLVTDMTPFTVKVDMSGVPKTLQVNQIDYIQYDEEPKELTKTRTLMRAGKYNDALEALNKLNIDDLKRPEMKQDVGYYKAVLTARMALAGTGSPKEAGTLLYEFEAKNKDSYHYL